MTCQLEMRKCTTNLGEIGVSSLRYLGPKDPCASNWLETLNYVSEPWTVVIVLSLSVECAVMVYFVFCLSRHCFLLPLYRFTVRIHSFCWLVHIASWWSSSSLTPGPFYPYIWCYWLFTYHSAIWYWFVLFILINWDVCFYSFLF